MRLRPHCSHAGDHDALPVRKARFAAFLRQPHDRFRREHRLDRRSPSSTAFWMMKSIRSATGDSLDERDRKRRLAFVRLMRADRDPTPSRAIAAIVAAYSPPLPLKSVTVSPIRSRSTRVAWCAAFARELDARPAARPAAT
jgi:hypothetical protein